jgi:hypothetical protein
VFGVVAWIIFPARCIGFLNSAAVIVKNTMTGKELGGIIIQFH